MQCQKCVCNLLGEMGVEHRLRKRTALTSQRKNKVPACSLPFLLSEGSSSCKLTGFPTAVSHRLQRVRLEPVGSGHIAEASSILTCEVKTAGLDIHVGMGTCSFRQGLQVTSCILLNYSNDNKKLTESKEILFVAQCHLPIYNLNIHVYA